MPIAFGDSIDLKGNQLLSLVLQHLAADPGTPNEGQLWYDSNAKAIKFRDDNSTNTLGVAGAGGNADTLDGNDSTFYLDRDNHTGDQAIGTIAATATARLFGRTTAGAGPGEELTQAQVRTFLALASTHISDFATAADARVAAVVTAAFVNALSGVDADTLGGSTAAQLQTATVAAITDSAPGTLDTLNELAAALNDDPNFATTITTALGTKTSKYAVTIGNGSATQFTITHNLNTTDVSEPSVTYAAGTRAGIIAGWRVIDANSIRVDISPAPATNEFRVVVMG